MVRIWLPRRYSSTTNDVLQYHELKSTMRTSCSTFQFMILQRNYAVSTVCYKHISKHVINSKSCTYLIIMWFVRRNAGLHWCSLHPLGLLDTLLYTTCWTKWTLASFKTKRYMIDTCSIMEQHISKLITGAQCYHSYHSWQTKSPVAPNFGTRPMDLQLPCGAL